MTVVDSAKLCSVGGTGCPVVLATRGEARKHFEETHGLNAVSARFQVAKLWAAEPVVADENPWPLSGRYATPRPPRPATEGLTNLEEEDQMTEHEQERAPGVRPMNRVVRHCTGCGAVGHRVDGCPKKKKTQPAPAPSTSARPESIRTPPHPKPKRPKKPQKPPADGDELIKAVEAIARLREEKRREINEIDALLDRVAKKLGVPSGKREEKKR